MICAFCGFTLATAACVSLQECLQLCLKVTHCVVKALLTSICISADDRLSQNYPIPAWQIFCRAFHAEPCLVQALSLFYCKSPWVKKRRPCSEARGELLSPTRGSALPTSRWDPPSASPCHISYNLSLPYFHCRCASILVLHYMCFRGKRLFLYPCVYKSPSPVKWRLTGSPIRSLEVQIIIQRNKFILDLRIKDFLFIHNT